MTCGHYTYFFSVSVDSQSTCSNVCFLKVYTNLTNCGVWDVWHATLNTNIWACSITISEASHPLKYITMGPISSFQTVICSTCIISSSSSRLQAIPLFEAYRFRTSIIGMKQTVLDTITILNSCCNRDFNTRLPECKASMLTTTPTALWNNLPENYICRLYSYII